MKKLKILSILLITLFMTGCVKLNANMKINKDKSMNYEIIMAFDKSIIDQAGYNFNEESLKTARKNGFEISEYNNGSMKGYKFTKHINNIDSISTKKDIKGSLDVDNNNKYMFTIKKGIIKNTYKAKLVTTSTDLSNIDPNLYKKDIISNNTTNSDYNLVNTSDNNIDYSSMKNIDLKFEVDLPYNALNSNASSNSGKKLIWNLLTFKNDMIEFEFELYNYDNIIIIGIVVLIILILIVIILNKKKKTPKEKDDNTISIDNNFGQANNISNIEEEIDAQNLWTDSNVQTVMPNIAPGQGMGQQIQPEEDNESKQPTSPNVFEQELQANNQNKNTY